MISSISPSNISIEKWYTPGIDLISFLIFSPSTINRGYTRLFISSLVSLTKSLVILFTLKRLGLLIIYFSFYFFTSRKSTIS